MDERFAQAEPITFLMLVRVLYRLYDHEDRGEFADRFRAESDGETPPVSEKTIGRWLSDEQAPDNITALKKENIQAAFWNLVGNPNKEQVNQRTADQIKKVVGKIEIAFREEYGVSIGGWAEFSNCCGAQTPKDTANSFSALIDRLYSAAAATRAERRRKQSHGKESRTVSKLSASDSIRGQLSELLLPVHAEYLLAEYTNDLFCGREDAFDAFRRFQASEERCLWVRGPYGVGKTAFIVQLARKKLVPPQALYFCRRANSLTGNPRYAILTLISSLFSECAPYREYWNGWGTMAPYPDGADDNTLIMEYLNKPLSRISAEPFLFVVDGLDEADGRLIRCLRDKLLPNTPPWLRFVFTSRNTPEIRETLEGCRQLDIGKDDLRSYFQQRLEPFNPDWATLDILVEKAAGNGLYAKSVCNEICRGIRDIRQVQDLPAGMESLYREAFERLFCAEGASYDRVRPLLSVVCAARQAPEIHGFLAPVLGVELSELQEQITVLAEFFSADGGALRPIHNSILEWLTSIKNARFYVDSQKGHAAIARYFLRHPEQKYAQDYLVEHLLLAGDAARAADLLQSPGFLESRLEQSTEEDFLYAYVGEIQRLSALDRDLAGNVMESPAFRGILGQYRKKLYAEGLYFPLKAADLDQVLREKEHLGIVWDCSAELSLAYYKYATQTFENAIAPIEALLATAGSGQHEETEMRNLLGICKLKNMDLDGARLAFRATCEDIDSLPSHRAEAFVNLGKICCLERRPDWQEQSRACFDQVVSGPEDAVFGEDDVEGQLMSAEYHRAAAYFMLWAGEEPYAEQKLEEAERLYQRVRLHGRYYARCLYTRALFQLLQGEDRSAEQILDACGRGDLLVKDYEKCQIEMLYGLFAAKKNDPGTAALHLKKARSMAKKIKAWVELTEIRAIAHAALGSPVSYEETKHLKDAKALEAWQEQVSARVRDLLALRGEKE